MDDLIYDRLSSDVDNALNNPGSQTNLKGAYNYNDLNRVETWCEYLQDKLSNYGFTETLDIKKNWNIRDYPTRTQIDRIRSNVKKLKDFCISVKGEILFNNTMNYEQANMLEKILYDIYISLMQMNVNIQADYKMGSILINKSYISLVMNSDIITENLQINEQYNIGLFLIKKDYIHLKAEGDYIENETINGNAKIGATVVLKEYINLKED